MLFCMVFKFLGFSQAPFTRRQGKMKNVSAVVLGMEALRSIPNFDDATEASAVVEMLKWFASFDFQRMAVIVDKKGGSTMIVCRDELPGKAMRNSTEALLMYFTFDHASKQRLHQMWAFADTRDIKGLSAKSEGSNARG